MANGFQIPSLLKYLLIAGFAAILSTGRGEDTARRVGILLEGAFESHEIEKSPEGAKQTQMVACYEWDYGIRSFTKAMWEEKGFEWDSFLGIAIKVADGLMEKIEPTVFRDGRGVIDCVLVADDDPFLTSIILSPLFLETFKDSLGDRIFVVPVDRNRLYLFPATGGKLEAQGPRLVDEFQQTDLPVSLEIFLVDKKGIQVVGELQR